MLGADFENLAANPPAGGVVMEIDWATVMLVSVVVLFLAFVVFAGVYEPPKNDESHEPKPGK